MLHVSTNGSRLHNPRIMELLAACSPYRITVSAYGATEASYDALVRRPGAFRLFSRGMAAALEAGLPLRLNIVLTKTNAHEQDAMIAMAERWGLRYLVYSNLSPTIYGGSEVLPTQSVPHLKTRKPFTGCNAGHTFFHVDPHGRASICKVGRDEQISLVEEGADGLSRMGQIAGRSPSSTRRRRHPWSTTASTEGGRCHDRGHGQDREPTRRHEHAARGR